jgi:transcriptional regulator with XRE-family HTH domain
MPLTFSPPGCGVLNQSSIPKKESAMKTFGQRVRELREGQRVGLNELARRVGINAAYLSKIERDVFPPPGEEKLLALARALDQDPDEFLAWAARIASDLPEIIQRHPRELAAFLRHARGLSAEAIERLTRQVDREKARK